MKINYIEITEDYKNLKKGEVFQIKKQVTSSEAGALIHAGKARGMYREDEELPPPEPQIIKELPKTKKKKESK